MIVIIGSTQRHIYNRAINFISNDLQVVYLIKYCDRADNIMFALIKNSHRHIIFVDGERGSGGRSECAAPLTVSLPV